MIICRFFSKNKQELTLVHTQTFPFHPDHIPIMFNLPAYQVSNAFYFNELKVEMESPATGYLIFKYIGRDQVNDEYLFLHE